MKHGHVKKGLAGFSFSLFLVAISFYFYVSSLATVSFTFFSVCYDFISVLLLLFTYWDTDVNQQNLISVLETHVLTTFLNI